MAGGRPVPLTAAARAALAAATVDAHRVTVVGEVPGPAWRNLKKVLETAGATYVTGRSRWEFSEPAAPIVGRILADGHAVADRHSEGYVPTPAALAARICGPEFADLGSLPPGALVLEPSAGDGVIAAAILRALPTADLWAVEPDRARGDQLGATAHRDGQTVRNTEPAQIRTAARCVLNVEAGHPEYRNGMVTLVRSTLEELTASLADRAVPLRFDAVVTNPPYNVTGAKDVWIDHVTAAYRLLKPGARLVAIVPAALTTRNDKRFAALRALADDHGGFRPLTQADFPGLGIGVGVLWLDRPPTGDDRPTWLFRRYTGAEDPVRVTDPRTSLGAARAAPVQVRYDPWCMADRTFVFVGRCMLCPRLVWGFIDGDNDPRGALGVHSCGWSLYPEQRGMTGSPAALCAACGNDGPASDTALRRARRVWAEAPADEFDLDAVEPPADQVATTPAIDAANTHPGRATQLDLFDLIAAA